MDQKFTLRVPFELSHGQEFIGFSQLTEQKVGNLSFNFEEQEYLHAIKVEGFKSEESAKEYFNRFWAGLQWITLNHNIAFSLTTQFDRVTYAADPEEAAKNLSKSFGLPIEGGVDGLINNTLNAVYPSDKKLMSLGVNKVRVLLQSPFEQVYPTLIEGISFPNSPSIISSPKLRTALRLYAASFNEYSREAKFLMLVISLETLAESAQRPEIISSLISKWKQEITKEKLKYKSNSEEFQALASLEGDRFLRNVKSVKNQIKDLVLDTLTGSVKNAEEFAQKAGKVYDQRSKLVHNGSLPDNELSEAMDEARKIAQEVLKAKFWSLANADND